MDKRNNKRMTEIVDTYNSPNNDLLGAAHRIPSLKEQHVYYQLEELQSAAMFTLGYMMGKDSIENDLSVAILTLAKGLKKSGVKSPYIDYAIKKYEEGDE